MMPWEDIQVQLIDTPPITPDLFDPALHGLIRGCGPGRYWSWTWEAMKEPTNARPCSTSWAPPRRGWARESALDEDDVGLSYTQTLLVANKIDLADAPIRLELLHEAKAWDFPEFVVSAETKIGLPELTDAIFRALDVVRVYTKLPRAKEADFERPFTIRRGGHCGRRGGARAQGLCRATQVRARVWNSGVHDGTTVKGDHVLSDKEIVELHI